MIDQRRPLLAMLPVVAQAVGEEEVVVGVVPLKPLRHQLRCQARMDRLNSSRGCSLEACPS
jgi:hypothetical protein